MPKTISSSRAHVSILLVSLALTVAACRAPILTPRPLTATDSPEITRVAILRALAESEWTFESERPGEIVARYGRSDWNMVVAIDYSNQVSVRYVSSENLRYGTSNGTPVIHRGYNKRVQRLANVIGTELAIARVGSGLPAVAAPPPGESRPQ